MRVHSRGPEGRGQSGRASAVLAFSLGLSLDFQERKREFFHRIKEGLGSRGRLESKRRLSILVSFELLDFPNQALEK